MTKEEGLVAPQQWTGETGGLGAWEWSLGGSTGG